MDVGYFSQFGASSLTDKTIAVDRFDPARAHIPNTYVPFRNANLLAIATSYAEARGADAIFIGVQALDYSGYPTAGRIHRCVPARHRARHTGRPHIELFTPFIHLTKTDILRWA